MSTNVAVIGQREDARPERWRFVATRVLYAFLATAGAALIVAFPPTFSTSAPTIISVVIVVAFLIFTERPQTTAGSTVAPLTAILAASAVTLGWWTLILAAVAAVTIQFHRSRDSTLFRKLASLQLAGQLGVDTISTYAMLSVWAQTQLLIARWPAATQLLTFGGIVLVGIVWQSLSNSVVAFACRIAGKSFPVIALLRPGLVASIYAYLLVAMYSFGGILAAALFYLVVAQFNVVQQTLGTTAKLLKLDRAQDQAAALVRDLSHLLDAESVEFGSEVQNIAQMIARHLGMARREVALIGLAAELHEIGKCRLAPRLRTNTDLNDSERAQYLTYPRIGAVMIRSSDALLPREIADWVEFHREHFDGGGGPRGLRGEAIPLAARIIALARAYVALLTGHDGVEQVTKEKALARLVEDSGALFDPALVDAVSDLVKIRKATGLKRVHEVADAG